MEPHLIKVLDQGFVSLIDFMGGDLAVVQGARVSFGQETKGDDRDRKLISYLMRHEHGTPFEMCLHGDTQIPTMPCARATQKIYTIRQLAEAFARGGKENSWVKLVNIRTVNKDGTISATRIKRAWRSGHRAVYRITIDNRLQRSILATSNHPFLTPDGYKQVSELKPGSEVFMNGTAVLQPQDFTQLWREGRSLEEIAAITGASRTTTWRQLQRAGIDTTRRSGFTRKDSVVDPRQRARKRIAITIGARCEVCATPAIDRHHIDKDIYNNQQSNIMLVCRPCHKALDGGSYQLKTYSAPIKSIEYAGETDVYDLEVASDNHNFVADGFVVHNCVFKFHVKAPIFVARQWFRHRVGSYNEISYRYVEVKDEFYVPSELRAQDAKNKQASFAGTFNEDETRAGQELIADAYRESYARYLKLLEMGVAREMARIVLPVGMYTQFYVAYNARSLMNFVRLRTGEGAQTEIRVYADAMNQIFKQLMPWTYEAFEQFVLKRNEKV